ncbi:MAG: bifunctional aspartate kinase/diaminopimelate decarboxylase [Coxiellaceae bacterium]|nr:bifunctional aspartate kinase/diaminopimelate decarboxylase [Coxiellaceae bacterium]
MADSTPWLVLKFGGTSVSSRERWLNIAEKTQQYLEQGYRLVIVCSAPALISNLLIEALESAPQQNQAEPLHKIRAIYKELCQQLHLDMDELLGDDLQALTKLFQGIELLGEASDKARAKIMSFGEVMLTRLGHAFLSTQSIVNQWRDARELLHALPTHDLLMSRCDDDADPALQQQLSNDNHVIITQGFIAGDGFGNTVLLGRGGSDSSAAYFAAKLQAERLEIWTDVPGIYTANPQQIAEARLLTQLNYDEAQEISSMGAKVLHPRCIEPVKKHNIPLHIKQTQQAERAGTVISIDGAPVNLPIKAIITKYNIVLITIETVSMWQQVGFLSQVFDCFTKHHLSIDLVSTSESSVTVSIDNNNGGYTSDTIDALLDELNQFSKARWIGPCASVSLIGENIRMVLHQLGETFEVFEAQQIHMMSLAANNLNLTFVVDSEQAERLAKQLHVLLVEQHPRRHQLGESWREACGDTASMPVAWWQNQRQALLDLMQQHESLYVYDPATIDDSIQQLKQLSAVDQIFYAMKANSFEPILKKVSDRGINFECVSMAEVNKILELFPSIDRKRILFTPNFAARAEYQQAIELGIYITVDSTYPIEHWPELFANQNIMLRVDPGYGAGHHKYVCTGGTDSKFGIPIDQLDSLQKQISKHSIGVQGLHIHSGSGILSSNSWSDSFNTLLELLNRFPQANTINLGGGLGIVEKPGQTPLDIHALNKALKAIKVEKPQLQLWMEPGRFVVARAGVIVAKVTQVKHKGDTTFVGIATGMNSLIRPALYGAYHEIVNLTRLDEAKTEIVNIVGPICESGDTLGYCRPFPVTQEGDIVLIANTGAYGYCMSSRYNLREPAEQLLLTTV